MGQIGVAWTMSNENRWEFLAQWSALNLLGWGIGFWGINQVSWFLFEHIDNVYLIIMLHGFFIGTSIGIFQWVKLRKLGINLFQWICVTALGWGVWRILQLLADRVLWNSEIPNFFQQTESGFSLWFFGQTIEVSRPALSVTLLIGVALISGALLGSLQVIVLRKHISKPGQWIGANIFGLLLLMATFGLISGSAFSIFLQEIHFFCDLLDTWYQVLIVAFLGIAILTGRVLLAHSTLSFATGAELGASEIESAWTIGESQEKFLAQWCALNFLGWGVGPILVGAGLSWILRSLFDEPVGRILFGGCVGAMAGILQWVKLRKSGLKLLKWTFVTALGGSTWAIFSGWVGDCWSLGESSTVVIQFMVTIAIGVALLGGLQLAIIKKHISRPVRWLRAYILGLPLPIVVGVLITIFHSSLKRAFFSLGFFSLFHSVSDFRWELIMLFLYITICLGISILTGMVLLAQSNANSAARVVEEK